VNYILLAEIAYKTKQEKIKAEKNHMSKHLIQILKYYYKTYQWRFNGVIILLFHCQYLQRYVRIY
jgi:hypothetical protein